LLRCYNQRIVFLKKSWVRVFRCRY